MKKAVLPRTTLTYCAAFACAVAIVGCVLTTRHEIDAHIVVDIRHIEEQASDLVDYIEGDREEFPELDASEAAPEAGLFKRTLMALNPIGVAHAQEGLKSDSARARELAQSMRERRPEIDKLKNSGYIGETNRGYVAVRPHDDLEEDDALKNEVQQLAAEENADRKQLYREIVHLNREHNATLTVVERVFAAEYLDRAKAGHHVQLPAGEAFQAFKGTPLGRKLGDEAQPGAWVVIPG
jgi:uncharacterized protein YdbL (DUF1318 family)